MKVTESFIREEKGIMSRVYIDPKTIGKMERNNRSMRSSSRYLIKQKKYNHRINRNHLYMVFSMYEMFYFYQII